MVVFLSGRPMFTSSLINQADAFVAAWLPGTQGKGVADVLVANRSGTAARDFAGRLPFAWPADARSPVVAPLFGTGYGLSYKRSKQIGRLSEDPKLDLAAFETATTFFRRGVVPAPWYLATDGVIFARPVDLSAQEDARQFSWTGPGKLTVEGPPLDLAKQAEAGAALVIEWRIDGRDGSPVRLALGGGTLDIGGLVGSAATGSVIETRIPLRCFAQAGANLTAVGGPLRLDAKAGFAATIRSARIDIVKEPPACPPTG